VSGAGREIDRIAARVDRITEDKDIDEVRRCQRRDEPIAQVERGPGEREVVGHDAGKRAGIAHTVRAPERVAVVERERISVVIRRLPGRVRDDRDRGDAAGVRPRDRARPLRPGPADGGTCGHELACRVGEARPADEADG